MSVSQTGGLGAVSVGIPELAVIIAIVMMSLIVVWPACRICGRIGYSPFLGVLAIIPLANMCLLWFVAFADWPARPEAGSWKL